VTTVVANNNDDDKKRLKDGLTAMAAALGEVTSLLVRSREHAGYTLPDLEWLLVPAIFNRQFLIVRAQLQGASVPLPAACLLWATVSDEIDAQYRATPGQRLKLSNEQRKSGDNVWITDFVGDRRMLNEAVNRLRAGTFKGRRISFFGLEDPAKPTVIDLMPQA
jgi:hemolysin-activating ACP:hemolysin acyltransferase